MKLLVVVLLALVAVYVVVLLNGCTEQVRTAPWSDSEVERLSDHKVNTVPVVVYEF